MKFEVENGYFGYQSQEILRNISFQLEQGEILAVLGSNGVGKTTLLKCMMNFLKWNRGVTKIDGIPLAQMGYKEIWKKISYVPQSKGTALSYTALEMVLMGLSSQLGLFAQPSEEQTKEAMEAMDKLGILWLKDKQCSRMSGGELQMVLIARALAAKPQLLILDEPESNLDFKNQLVILDIIKKLSKKYKIGSIINTHYPVHALKIANKALILNRDGSSVYGNAGKAITEETMEKAFSVEVKISDFYYEDQCYKNVIPIAVIS